MTTKKSNSNIPLMQIKNHILHDQRVRIGDSPNQGGTIKPTVIVLHYTASGGPDGTGDASYLSRASSRASAHVVVGRDGSIDQIVPFNKRAWHAGKSSYKGRDDVNDFSIGIEIDNWGWLKDGRSHLGELVPEQFRFSGTRSGHSEWEAYRGEQLTAVEEVIQAICNEYPITDIVGHEDVAPGRKQDPGPALDEFKQQMQERYLDQKGTKQKPQPKKARATAERTTTANLRLRAASNTYSTILTTMPKGSKVTVMSEWKGWSRVRYGNRVGFADSSYLT